MLNSLYSTVCIQTAIVFAYNLSSRMQSVLHTHTDRIKGWAVEPLLVESTKIQNAKKMPLKDIQRIDQEWRNGQNHEFALSLQTKAVGQYLKEIITKNKLYTEAFVYDQMGKGKTYVSPISHDDSTSHMSVQISVPIVDGDKTIGLLVAGIENI